MILGVLLAALYGFLAPSYSGYRLMPSFLGFCLGAYGSYLFRLNPDNRPTLPTRILNAAATILIVFFIYFLTRHFPAPIQSFLIAFWISFAAIAFCRAFLPTFDSKK